MSTKPIKHSSGEGFMFIVSNSHQKTAVPGAFDFLVNNFIRKSSWIHLLLASIHSLCKRNKKAYQLKANYPLANRCIDYTSSTTWGPL